MMPLEFGTMIAIAVAIFAMTVVAKGAKVVAQSECMIVERLGRYSRTLSSGFNVILPFIDATRPTFWVTNGVSMMTDRIDLRETVLDVPQQDVITRDNVSISIDAILYVQIMDPTKAVYEIANLPNAVAQLAQTSLRNVIGEMDLDQTLSSRDTINAKLKAILDDATDKWGTKVNRVELRNITPPKDIQNAMEKQMQAERERRAKVLEAEGDKQARIARSEGQRQEQINLASADKEARILQASGEAEGVRLVAESKMQAIEQLKTAIGNPELATKFLVSDSYIKAMAEFTQKDGDKVYVPYESASALSAIGSIKELLGSKS